ncbi:MAG: carboxypeptidase-like regulatory domain-containing protein [Pyrinomonadaceae bacterium]
MPLQRATPVLLFALLLCDGSLYHAFAQSRSNSESASVAGQSLVVEVRDAAGRPLKHACVTYISKNGEVQFRNADGRGRVEFRNLTTGDGRVVAKFGGYAAQKKSVSIKDGAATIAFALEPREVR